jgi:hypothetical protein
MIAAVFAPWASAATAQGSGINVSYGRWWRDGDAAAGTLTIAYYRHFFGPVDYGLGVTHLDDGQSPQDRTQTGGELSLAVGRDGSGPYAVSSAGLAMRHSDGNLDAQWSAGAGYAVRPVPFLSVGLEARYRVEDRDVRGFWRLDPDDRRGMMLQGRVALSFGSPARVPRRRSPRPLATVGRSEGGANGNGGEFEPPSEAEIGRMARSGGSSRDAAELAAQVVGTAIDLMGTPYRWGGTDENGFDCSGLIKYAYEEHQIIIPRVSRDQIRTGAFVEPRVDQLRPGDILGFSVERARVSHVGLYIGEGKFIHSASGGVRISSLTATDANSRWWQQRFVAARRIVN